MKLHLGCGTRHIPGFVHIDVAPHPHVDHVQSVDRLGFIADGSTSLIYASHVLEHFSRQEVPRVLREWHRVLKPGGVLRLAVPDFAAVVEIYHREGFVDGFTGVIGLVCGGQRDPWDFHKIIFDRQFLTRLLHEAGFSEVRSWDWRRTEHAQVDDFSQAYLPHLDKQHGKLMSLNLEGVK
jgi:predicted SAM-dependent methyltransferase